MVLAMSASPCLPLTQHPARLSLGPAKPALTAPLRPTLLPHQHLSLSAWQHGRDVSHNSLPPRWTASSLQSVDNLQSLQSMQSYDESALSSTDMELSDYKDLGIKEIVNSRLKFLAVFCVGLLVAAFIIEKFEGVLEQHVELSFFLPLIMGQGGNSGSQTVSNIIRAIALKQARWKMVVPIVFKEAAAGGIMGGAIGLVVLLLSFVWSEISIDVGFTVAVALPLVSLWANAMAALITLASNKLKFDPALTSGPLVSTLVDTTGLMIYFWVAQVIMQQHLATVWPIALLHHQ